jgi:hypothetical protein
MMCGQKLIATTAFYSRSVLSTGSASGSVVGDADRDRQTKGSASPRTVPFAIVKSASVRKSARRDITRRNFSLAAERAALIRSLSSAEKNLFAMCSDFRDAGQHWLNIRAECKERRINAGKWATENAPIKLRWLDRYGEFARRWDEFLESWKWSEALPYSRKAACGAL